MTQIVTTKQLNEWITKQENLEILEVLGTQQFDEFHLPGAINVPVNKTFENTIKQHVPQKDQKIVVYSWDKSCQQAPKAASQLEQLGYTNVYCLQDGKQGWKEAGLPTEAGATAAAA